MSNQHPHCVKSAFDGATLVCGSAKEINEPGLQDLRELGWCLTCFSQIAISLCKITEADQALIDAAADGTLAFTLQVETFERVDPANLSIAPANVKRSHISTVNIYVQGGELIINSALVGAFNPDAINVQVTDNLGLSVLCVGPAH